MLRKNIENELGKVLGMEWKKEEDVIQFRLCNINEDEETTKRTCLSTIYRFYDPVGLLTPVSFSKDHPEEDMGPQAKGWLE